MPGYLETINIAVQFCTEHIGIFMAHVGSSNLVSSLLDPREIFFQMLPGIL